MAKSLNRREPFAGIVELHERMGHPVRVGALGTQAFCVHCNLLWSAHPNLTLGLEYAYWDFGEIATAGSEQYEEVIASAKLSF